MSIDITTDIFGSMLICLTSHPQCGPLPTISDTYRGQDKNLAWISPKSTLNPTYKSVTTQLCNYHFEKITVLDTLNPAIKDQQLYSQQTYILPLTSACLIFSTH